MAIDVYGATWCGDCHRAKNALDRFGAAYTWHDIEQEEGAADRAVEISGQKHIPVVLYGDGSFQVERPSWTSRTSSRSLACSGER